jgi:hypothetical protein
MKKKQLTASEMVARRNKKYGKKWLKENGQKSAQGRKRDKLGHFLPK